MIGEIRRRADRLAVDPAEPRPPGVLAGRRLDAGAESCEPEHALDLGGHRPGAVALGERHLVERGAAQATPRRQKRDRLDQVGLAGAVRPGQHHEVAADLQARRVVAAEVGQGQAADQRPAVMAMRSTTRRHQGLKVLRRSRAKASHPHRHQHVERALGVLVLDQGRRAGIGEAQHRHLAVELGRDVEQIARVESDIDRIGRVIDLDLLGGAAGIRVGDGQDQLAGGQRQLDGAAAFARHRRDAIDRGLEVLLVDHQFLVVAARDDARIVRERAVDQFRGQHHVADREADLGRRQFDGDLGRGVLDQPLHLDHGLARHDDAGHAGSSRRHREIGLRQAVAVGRDGAQRLRLARAGDVQIDAVEVVARLLGRDGELGLVDQPLQVGAGSVNLCVMSPAARSGKSLSGRVCRVKRERPARTASTARSLEDSSTTCEPSGSLRTIS